MPKPIQVFYLCLVLLNACNSQAMLAPERSIDNRPAVVVPSVERILPRSSLPAETQTRDQPAPQNTPEPIESNQVCPFPLTEPATNDRKQIQGRIFNDEGTPLQGVSVLASSLHCDVAYFEKTETDPSGLYKFDHAPIGIQIKISASHPGYTKRSRVEVLHRISNHSYDFGSDETPDIFGNAPSGSINNALSDKPEVITSSPQRNSSENSPDLEIKLNFSEPMDTQSVEDNFLLSSFTEETLSVDQLPTFYGFRQNKKGYPLVPQPELTTDSPQSGSPIWDKNAFEITWNEAETEARFKIKHNLALPTDKNAQNAPEYYISFTHDNKKIKDKKGIERLGDYFKLTRGQYEGAMKFGIKRDTLPPQLNEIIVEENILKLQFSEPMRIPTLSMDIAGGINGEATQAAAAISNQKHTQFKVLAEEAAGNYSLRITTANGLHLGPINWQNWGGQAQFNADDPSHSSVNLIPPRNLNNTSLKTNWPDNSQLELQLILADGSIQKHQLNPGPIPLSFVRAINELFETEALVLHRENKLALSTGWQRGEKIRLELTNTRTTRMNKPLLGLHFVSGNVVEAFTEPLFIYPQSKQGAVPQLWQSGDQIHIEVAETVLDPAGNGIQSDARSLKFNVGEKP